MNIKEDIKPISYLKSHAAEVIKTINETHRPVIITQNGEAKGVFVDSESYQKMKDSINLMKMVILSENEIDNGQYKEQNELFDAMESRFEKLKNEL